MPKIVEKQEFEILEPGVYLAELIDYSDQRDDGTPLMSSGKYGDPKPQWRFAFELLDYPDPGRQISAWINKPRDLDAISQNSNLTAMATALLGVGVGQEWEIDDLLHKRCKVQIEWFKKADGSEAHKIGKFYKLEPRSARQQPAREPVAAGARKPASEESDPPF